MEKINNIQETLLKIRKEAERRVAESRYEKSKKPKLVVPKVKPSTKLAKVAPEIDKELIDSLSKKAAMLFVYTATDKIREASLRSIDKNANDKLNAFQENGKVAFYPKNCKLLVSNKNTGCVVIEEEPQYRTVFTNDKNPVRIPLPYITYIIGYYLRNGSYTINNYGIAFGKKPISSIDEYLFDPNLPHTDVASICLPLNKTTFNTLEELTDYFIKQYWNTKFHYDFIKFDLKNKSIKSFKEWSQIENPLDILSADFRISGYTIRQLIRRIGAEDREGNNPVMQKMQTIASQILNSVDENVSVRALTEVISNSIQEVLKKSS